MGGRSRGYLPPTEYQTPSFFFYMRIGFLIREVPGMTSTALQNAARIDAAALEDAGHTARVQVLSDAKVPDDVSPDADLLIIEGGGWIDLMSLDALKMRIPRIVVRFHAAAGFLYYEFPGVSACDALEAYRERGIEVAFVDRNLAVAFRAPWLSMQYGPGHAMRKAKPSKDIHLGALGWIRPLKNHLVELLAASKFAVTRFSPRPVYFHINAKAGEDYGCLKEFRLMAKYLPTVQVVEHPWMDRAEFLRFIREHIHIGMCGSLAESFCLTAADYIRAGIPVVASSHIPWLPGKLAGWRHEGGGADVRSLAGALCAVFDNPDAAFEYAQMQLGAYARTVGPIWRDFLCSK